MDIKISELIEAKRDILENKYPARYLIGYAILKNKNIYDLDVVELIKYCEIRATFGSKEAINFVIENENNLKKCLDEEKKLNEEET